MDDAAASVSVDLVGSGAEPLTPGDPPAVGPYRAVGALGAGRTGKVFLGLDLSLAGSWPGGVRLVAVKAVWPRADDDLLTAFHYELATLGRLPVGAGSAPSMWDQSPRPRWYATDYTPGVSVAQTVALGHRLPAASAWLLVDQVARALAAGHAAGVVPGDLKPSGVLLTREGAKLVDFGSSRPADRLRPATAGQQDAPNASFIAPEQAAGREDLTGAADVFALGALVWFAMSGEPPFGRGPSPEVLARVLHLSPDLGPLRGIDAALAEVVEVCLAKDPAARPSPAALIERCSAFARGFVGGASGGAGAPRWPGEVMALVEQRAAFVQRVTAATDDTTTLPVVPATPAAPTTPAPQDPTVALGVPKLPPPPSARQDPTPTLVDATGGALLGAALSASAGPTAYYASAPPTGSAMAPPQVTAYPAPSSASEPDPAPARSQRYRVEMAASITAAVALILASAAWALHSGGHTAAAGATSPAAPVVITPSAAASDPAATPSTDPNATDTDPSDTPTPTPTPTPTSTTPTANPPGTGPVTSGIGGECLAVAGGSTNDGTPAQLAACDNAPDQTWSGQGGTVQFGGKCLDVVGRGTANGTLVQLWSCNGGPNQQWSAQPDGTLVSAQSGRCLDDPNGSTAAGVQLQIWDCHGGGNQTWTLP